MNADQIVIMVIGAVLNGLMLAVGMIIGTRLTAKSMRKEADAMLEESETMQAIKKVIVDPKKLPLLIDRAIKFFENATAVVESPEAKNFFKNATKALKEFSGEPKKDAIKLPAKPRS